MGGIANADLKVMSSAVKEIMEKAVTAFINDDTELAATVEPLEQVINNLKAQLRSRHAKRGSASCTCRTGSLFRVLLRLCRLQVYPPPGRWSGRALS